MNENENRKGPGVFYAVVGVATLVVAIIGATFAYFSASASATGNNIEGQTLDLTGTDLAITVTRVTFPGDITDKSLVPAWFGTHEENETTVLDVATPAALGTADIVSMVTNSCVNSGYTGCHVYKITYTNNGENTLSNANVWLELYTTGVTDTAQWGYAVFKPTAAAEGTVEAATVTAVEYAAVDTSHATDRATPTPASVTKTNHDSIGAGFQRLDIHNNASLTTGDHVLYLIIYVNDDNLVQNAAGTVTGTNVIGSYAGTVSLDAMGGKVRASFGA